MVFPDTRETALARLEEFVGIAPRYGRERNFVKAGHPSVSRLSAAIRHRLISEDEVAARVMAAHPFHVVEKFVQEVYWRVYWKSWLSLRPRVWEDFSSHTFDPARVREVGAGKSGNAVIDRFARELADTGYLHNHARMWVAAWWIHQARLPWQAGARWFMRHLLDADPASNTLSWRWVAGLQTPGKTYLARRANLETYLDPAWLKEDEAGLMEFENPRALPPEGAVREPVTLEHLPESRPDALLKSGLLIHEEDLSVEQLPWTGISFSSIRVLGIGGTDPSTPRGKWLHQALHDAARRAETRWKTPVAVGLTEGPSVSIRNWAASENLEQIVLMRPAVGPVDDRLRMMMPGLQAEGLRIAMVDREMDLRFRPLARAGFFGFWEKVRKQLDTAAAAT